MLWPSRSKLRAGVEVDVHALVEHQLAEAERERRLGREQLGEGHRLRPAAPRADAAPRPGRARARVSAVTISPVITSRLARARPTSFTSREQPPEPGIRPTLFSGKPSLAVVGGEAEVAGERELEAAARGDAVDRRDHRHLHRLDLVEDVVHRADDAAKAPGADLGQALHAAHVLAGGEGPAGAGDDQDAQGVVGDERARRRRASRRASAWFQALSASGRFSVSVRIGAGSAEGRGIRRPCRQAPGERRAARLPRKAARPSAASAEANSMALVRALDRQAFARGWSRGRG